MGKNKSSENIGSNEEEVSILNWEIRENLTKKVAFQPRFEKDERRNYMNLLEGTFQTEEQLLWNP